MAVYHFYPEPYEFMQQYIPVIELHRELPDPFGLPVTSGAHLQFHGSSLPEKHAKYDAALLTH